jgi:hypothetical protein
MRRGMGVCYVLACHDCKKMLDAGKNKALANVWYGMPTEHTQDLANPFRFVRRHWGHKVELHSDESEDFGYSFTYQEEFGK